MNTDSSATQPTGSPSSPGEAPAPVVTAELVDRTLLVTLDRPEVRNAVDTDVARQLGAAVARAEDDPDIWCLVLTGAGEQSFCAGADLKALGRGQLPIDPDHQERGFGGYVTHHVSVPTIAAVNGTALGGGTELALASDLVVAADTATFGLPEVRRGIIAAAGGILRLPQQLPPKVAMRMILTGEPITAADALRWGLVNEVVAPAALRDRALDLAERICANAPLAVQASKRIATGVVDGALPHEAEGWVRNQSEVERVVASADAMEGIMAFVEKRDPTWQGR